MPWPRAIRFRFSLRALLVFLTLFAIWSGYHTNRALKARRAVSVLHRYGASTDYLPDSYESSVLYAPWHFYQTLAGWIWHEPRISHVAIDSQLEADVLEALISLNGIQSLALTAARTPDETNTNDGRRETIKDRVSAPPLAIKTILSRHQLRALEIEAFSLSNDDFEAIAMHTTLTTLTVNRTNVSERWISQLLALPHLQHFRCCYCHVTGSSITDQQASASLQTIECKGTPLTSRFAGFVSRCPNVRQLSVLHWAIDDAFIAALGTPASLSSLDLWRAGITDKSLPRIQQMPSLTSLLIGDSYLSPEGVKAVEHFRRWNSWPTIMKQD